jgi:hypothetical protein
MNANINATGAEENLLLKEIEYQWEETVLGTWRRFVYPNGSLFAEFKSHGHFGPLPILHYTHGKCPETGRRIVAHGFIAIGRLARGVIAIGHASVGIIAIGQLAIGLGFGLGQAATGVLAIGQLGLGAYFGLGQIATGHIAIGQVAVGGYVLAQCGFGTHVWDAAHGVDATAKAFFSPVLRLFGVDV